MLEGRCHCGAIRYRMAAEARHALCHCEDCRRASGAPAVAWGLIPREGIEIVGRPQVYASSEHGRRHFCGECGSGLFYTNDVIFPGMIDVQTATLDRPVEGWSQTPPPTRKRMQQAIRPKSIQWPANERFLKLIPLATPASLIGCIRKNAQQGCGEGKKAALIKA